MLNDFKASELVLNPDGSVYHIALVNDDIANDVILVGDPGRVQEVAFFFDTIELKKSHREFNTITGTYRGKRISVLSTGIGTDNIDIVLTELDAAVNIDLETRSVKEERRSLNLIRLGTCGALHSETEVDTQIVSTFGLGFDGLAHYYKTSFNDTEIKLAKAFIEKSQWPKELAKPYVSQASSALLERLAKGKKQGMTATATGFYGPQGRALRLGLAMEDMHERLKAFEFEGNRILNFEMESSALYFLANSLGHHPLTICTVVANRSSMTFSRDYKRAVRKMIVQCLDGLTNDW